MRPMREKGSTQAIPIGTVAACKDRVETGYNTLSSFCIQHILQYCTKICPSPLDQSLHCLQFVHNFSGLRDQGSRGAGDQGVQQRFCSTPWMAGFVDWDVPWMREVSGK